MEPVDLNEIRERAAESVLDFLANLPRTTDPVRMLMTERDDMPRIDPHDFTNRSSPIDRLLNNLALETLARMNALASNEDGDQSSATMLHGASAVRFNLMHPDPAPYSEEYFNYQRELDSDRYRSNATYRPSQSTAVKTTLSNATKLEGMDAEVPESLTCPITKDIMTNPVYFRNLKSKNIQCFEYEAIIEVMKIDPKHPFTREVLSIQSITPNDLLKKECDDFVAQAIMDNNKSKAWCNIL